MTNWQTKKLGECLTIRHGRNQRAVEALDGEYPIFGTGGQIGRAKKYLYDKPSVLIGRKGTIDKPRYMNTPFWTVDTLFYSEMKNGINAKFMYYVFNTIDWHRYNEASGVPSLSASTISTIKVVLPEKPEQERIVGVLGVWDEYIEKLEQKIALKEQLKKSLMQQLLTGKRRLPGFNDAWVETSLGQLYKITSSKRVFESDWTREGVPFYRAREIIKLRDNGHVDNELFISKVMFEKYKSKYGAIKENDILVTGVGTIGVAYRVRNFTNFYFKDGNIIWLKSQAKVSSTFIEHLFNSSIIKRQIHRLTPVTTVATYTIEMANATKVLLPAQDEQDAISAVLTKAGDDVTCLKQMKKLIMRQKKYLLKKLITGEIRTPETLVPEGVEP